MPYNPAIHYNLAEIMANNKPESRNENIENHKVCALILTWNSGESIHTSLPAISGQVDEVVVIDNGSRPDELAVVENAVRNFKNAALIKNSRNEGVGGGFNSGAEYALRKGYGWIITLDDAANPEKDLVKKLFAAYASLSPQDQEKTAVIAPNYTNLKGTVYPGKNPYFVPTTVQTGQLVKTSVWKTSGRYKEDLFVMWVDHEFCLRLLQAGYKILLVPDAVLEETAGPKPILKSFLGRKFVVPNYSAARYYYMYRNSVYMYKTYWRLVPRWLLNNLMSEVMSFGKIVLFEDHKLRKIVSIVRGYFDGIRNKFGELTA